MTLLSSEPDQGSQRTSTSYSLRGLIRHRVNNFNGCNGLQWKSDSFHIRKPATVRTSRVTVRSLLLHGDIEVTNVKIDKEELSSYCMHALNSKSIIFLLFIHTVSYLLIFYHSFFFYHTHTHTTWKQHGMSCRGLP